ncbi:unnamed protein product [Polarella glacialis]|uniref:Uncharacterized protein n=1 Tax=Polarella glacialis TaxID=89957 RepID=A0A813H0I4_POLGL|nr:unnamed protein product [Polarella glacialis]CAE8645355.1 unnamed protein product [Polarella glacialis]
MASRDARGSVGAAGASGVLVRRARSAGASIARAMSAAAGQRDPSLPPHPPTGMNLESWGDKDLAEGPQLGSRFDAAVNHENYVIKAVKYRGSESSRVALAGYAKAVLALRNATTAADATLRSAEV